MCHAVRTGPLPDPLPHPEVRRRRELSLPPPSQAPAPAPTQPCAADRGPRGRPVRPSSLCSPLQSRSGSGETGPGEGPVTSGRFAPLRRRRVSHPRRTGPPSIGSVWKMLRRPSPIAWSWESSGLRSSLAAPQPESPGQAARTLPSTRTHTPRPFHRFAAQPMPGPPSDLCRTPPARGLGFPPHRRRPLPPVPAPSRPRPADGLRDHVPAQQGAWGCLSPSPRRVTVGALQAVPRPELSAVPGRAAHRLAAVPRSRFPAACPPSPLPLAQSGQTHSRTPGQLRPAQMRVESLDSPVASRRILPPFAQGPSSPRRTGRVRQRPRRP